MEQVGAEVEWEVSVWNICVFSPPQCAVISGTGNGSQSSVSAVRDIRSSRFLSHSFFTSTRGRGLMRDLRRGLLMPPSRSPIVPASEVPEELVQQAQAVLQVSFPSCPRS